MIDLDELPDVTPQDLDLLDENRSLLYSGKLLRQPEGSLEWSVWGELFVLLFDNFREYNRILCASLY
jgi:hypothetical protein